MIIGAREGRAIQCVHTASLLISGVLTFVVLTGVMAFYYLSQTTYPGFRDWLVAVTGQTVGLALLLTYPAQRQPPLLVVLFTSLVLVASFDRFYRGTALFAGAPARFSPFERVFYVGALAAFLYFLFLDYWVPARVAVVGACMALVSLQTAAVGLRLARGAYRASGRFLAAVQVAGAAIHLTRAGAALVGASALDLPSRSGLDAALLAALTSCGVALVLSLLLLTAQRTQLELAEARAQVLRLEGIIPICMYCHKVRNDREAWDQIETYLVQHSSAQLSHGICPECLAIHFPSGNPDPGRR